MVKIIFTLLIIFLIVSCGHETIYGKRRFKINIEQIKQNKDFEVFKIIDTTKLYGITTAVHLPDSTNLNSVKQIYLKFYGNGKMGVFSYFNSKDVNSLNPALRSLI